ncbi:pentatricopeptide repeat-containing protein At3g14730 [Manihot esculenta]|uniref:Pentatricopeptide repeat-containing protein n=1 Tax=Manihot esculenta TaxID=3983 RepID=A0A2C9U5S9_MANES|nr:pentatricopeptide repeat-containing protein At3g14730 [Manihot esculenta]XP_043808404.1 pentatricopeptide repeat-containing protein At3g14730 [Manihot esculenta]XP_043808405.1 pentatricopeptide repeat-containing protein At3g14730 [Manihot esculenta]XP_043808406.1 pentatricopeptide repeat-containing protein At3g14730 [Manihot esculenta]XP_043808407.1 pentatricopeptide repeat-containing protein At3g14730 [Manihot esculenta]XP_043808408.1 pentatricopeptide repeat-containing protein At3g14730 [
MKKAALVFKIPTTKLPPCTFYFSTSSLASPLYNITTCVASFKQCILDKSFKKGQQLHAQLLITGLQALSPAYTTSLINMYAKCNRMNQALLVFNSTPDCDRNVFTHNAIISGFVSNGLARYGIEFYKEMRRLGVLPDKVTLPCLLKGLCEITEVYEVKKIHGLAFKLGLELDVFVGSALVSSYLKFALVDEAHVLFDKMPERDVVLWNSMINGCAQTGKFNEALGVFRRMRKEGVPIDGFTVTGILSVFAVTGDFDKGRTVHGFVIKVGFGSDLSICNALIDMYGKCDCIAVALEIFEEMDEKDIYSWNSIISISEQAVDYDETLRLFNRMFNYGIHPDLVTIKTVLAACSHVAALMHGREIHSYIIVNGLAKDGKSEDINYVLLNNAILDMYAKCGSMRDAHLVFDQMICKDVASWNIMILGYGMHGYGNEALGLFSLMCATGFMPNEVTFVGVLSACGHAGFVTLGREFLRQMELKYGVTPSIDHYACVIDMLGRAGQLEEAYELAKTMPVKANPVAWRALLAACQLHCNADLAEIVARHIFELDPGHCGSYVLMSNVYVTAGRYKEVLDVRHTMRQQNVKKAPGCSWIELKNGLHTFITGDQIHPEANCIYSVLRLLTSRLSEQGYVPHLV